MLTLEIRHNYENDALGKVDGVYPIMGVVIAQGDGVKGVFIARSSFQLINEVKRAGHRIARVNDIRE